MTVREMLLLLPLRGHLEQVATKARDDGKTDTSIIFVPMLVQQAESLVKLLDEQLPE